MQQYDVVIKGDSSGPRATSTPSSPARRIYAGGDATGALRGRLVRGRRPTSPLATPPSVHVGELI